MVWTEEDSKRMDAAAEVADEKLQAVLAAMNPSQIEGAALFYSWWIQNLAAGHKRLFAIGKRIQAAYKPREYQGDPNINPKDISPQEQEP